MATRALPLLCIFVLLFSASLVVLPSTEAARILLETSRIQGWKAHIPGYGAINPDRPACPEGRCNPGQPYRRPCTKYKCPP